MSTTLHEKTLGTFTVTGNLYRNSDIYQVNGEANLNGDMPTAINLILTPKHDPNNKGAIKYSIHDAENGKVIFFKAFRGDRYANFGGKFIYKSITSWKYALGFNSSEAQIDEITFNAEAKPERNGEIIGNYELRTPWKSLGIDNVRIESNILIDTFSGHMTNRYQMPHVKSWSKTTWSWLLNENMQVAIESHTNREGTEPKMFEASAKYLNPVKDYSSMTYGALINVNDKWK